MFNAVELLYKLFESDYRIGATVTAIRSYKLSKRANAEPYAQS